MSANKAIRPFEKRCRALHAEFLRALFESNGVTCAIDVGANRGQSRDFLRDIVGFDGMIVSVEPNPVAYREMAARHPEDRLWLKCCSALGATRGHGELIVTRNDRLSSFLEPKSFGDAAGPLAPMTRVPVHMHRLDSIVRRLHKMNPDHKFFVKLDTQGFDIEVMRGLEDRFLDSLRVVQAEVATMSPFYSKAPGYLDALRYFEERGFHLAAAINVISDHRYRAIELDCIFVR